VDNESNATYLGRAAKNRGNAREFRSVWRVVSVLGYWPQSVSVPSFHRHLQSTYGRPSFSVAGQNHLEQPPTLPEKPCYVFALTSTVMPYCARDSGTACTIEIFAVIVIVPCYFICCLCNACVHDYMKCMCTIHVVISRWMAPVCLEVEVECSVDLVDSRAPPKPIQMYLAQYSSLPVSRLFCFVIYDVIFTGI